MVFLILHLLGVEGYYFSLIFPVVGFEDPLNEVADVISEFFVALAGEVVPCELAVIAFRSDSQEIVPPIVTGNTCLLALVAKYSKVLTL